MLRALSAICAIAAIIALASFAPAPVHDPETVSISTADLTAATSNLPKAAQADAF